MKIAELDVRPDEARNLEAARLARGFKTAKDAATYFGWNYETYAQHENGTRGLSRSVDKYAKAFRVDPGWILFRSGRGPSDQVPLKGYIGAGQQVLAIDAGADDMIEAPADSNPDTVAGVIKGDSMLPLFQDGWILYWSRQLPPDELR